MKSNIRSLLASAAVVAAIAVLALPVSALAKGKAKHVVVLVWDGMRRDFISPQYTPNLYRLVTNGVFFKRHHPVYISSTEVNGTALATGCNPATSGIIANQDYRPEVSVLGPTATEGIENIRQVDKMTGGRYVEVPTLAETLQENGIATITAGTKPVVLLHDRDNKKTSEAGTNSVLLYKGKTIPRGVEAGCAKANDDKAFPGAGLAGDNWTAKATLNYLWRKGVPKYSLLWLSEPDAAQHADGVAHPNALTAIENSDRILGDVLKKLEEKGVKDQTDVLVVSDHGFSTILRGPDVMDILKKAKFRATRKHEDPEKGDVLVVGLGGSSCLYVYDNDDDVTRRLAEFLQTTDFAGVIFSRVPVEGTFPLEAVRLNATNVVPDIVVSYRWFDVINDNGAPGLIISDTGTKGKGTHASLSRYDMLNTAVGWGPDFKKGYASEIPSGNVDITPTVLHILGIKPATRLDGRVLTEALVGGEEPQFETRNLEASRVTGIFRWKQHLKQVQVGNTVYFDEGNGGREWR